MMKLRTVLAPRKPAAMRGAVGAMVMKAPIDAMLAPSKVEFTMCFAGIATGLDDIRPASLRNATTDPVNVIPPIQNG